METFVQDAKDYNIYEGCLLYFGNEEKNQN